MGTVISRWLAGTGRAVFCLGVALVVGLACGRAPSKPGKVVVLGMDGLELSLVKTLAQGGELPNFKRLMDEGYAGDLQTIEPMLSPAIWTTIASGYLPDVHGVRDWVDSQGRLSSAADVKSYRLWEMISEEGMSALVSGWLMTTPATPLNGMLLSDRLVWNMSMDSYDRERGTSVLRDGEVNAHMKGIAYPDALIEVATRWVPTGSELAATGLSYQLEAYGVGRHPLPKDETHLRSFEALWGEQNLGMLYLFSADQVSHLYWPFIEEEALTRLAQDADSRVIAFRELHEQKGHENDRRAFPWVSEPITQAQVEEGRRWLPDTYRWLDQALGRVLAKIDPVTTTLIVLSDHGFQKASHLVVLDSNHKNPGTLMAWGRSVKPGEPVSAHVRQVAPTVLKLLGAAGAEDMVAPIAGLFTYPGDVASRESWAVLPALAERPAQDPTALKEQLRALGYLD